MIDKKQIEKYLSNYFSLLSQYVIIVFNRKRRYNYINTFSSKIIFINILIVIGIITSILFYATKLYNINKPLPVIYIPVYTFIFSFIYLFLSFSVYDKSILKSNKLINIKQLFFSNIIVVSFYCIIIIIFYCIYIITESYFLYYITIAVIILSNIHFIPIRRIIIYRKIKKVAILIRLFISILFITSILNLILLNQFSFIYKGKIFVYTFDPIHQEFLDNIKEQNEILMYISKNTSLADDFLFDVINNNNFSKYNLLIEQIDSILIKEEKLINIYEGIIFNKNKIIYKQMIAFIENLKQLKNELKRLQFVGKKELTEIKKSIEHDIQQLENDREELQKIYSSINENNQDSMENFNDKIDIIQKNLENIRIKKDNNNYVLSQNKINILVISEINKLIKNNNDIYKNINNEMNNDIKRIKKGIK